MSGSGGGVGEREAVNGEIFFDNYGEVTRIREKLSYYPEYLRLKKLAGHALLMGQAGQYNYSRCISRGDTAAAQLAAIEFVKSAMSAIFLINKTNLKSKVIKNIDGSFYTDSDNMQEILANHIVSAVRFDKTIELMRNEGVDTFIEIGPGKAVTGFVKKE